MRADILAIPGGSVSDSSTTAQNMDPGYVWSDYGTPKRQTVVSDSEWPDAESCSDGDEEKVELNDNLAPPGSVPYAGDQFGHQTRRKMSDALVSPKLPAKTDSGKYSTIYDFSFWKGFVAIGGNIHSPLYGGREYSDAGFSQAGAMSYIHLRKMPGAITQWCMRLREVYQPRCKRCRKSLPPCIVRDSNPVNAGAVYYACDCCEKGFNYWASDYWSYMYRMYLRTRSVQVVSADEGVKTTTLRQAIEALDTQVVDLSSQPLRVQANGTLALSEVVDLYSSAHSAFVGRTRPQLGKARPVKHKGVRNNRALYIFTLFSCFAEIESLTVRVGHVPVQSLPSVSIIDSVPVDVLLIISFVVCMLWLCRKLFAGLSSRLVASFKDTYDRSVAGGFDGVQDGAADPDMDNSQDGWLSSGWLSLSEAQVGTCWKLISGVVFLLASIFGNVTMLVEWAPLVVFVLTMVFIVSRHGSKRSLVLLLFLATCLPGSQVIQSALKSNHRISLSELRQAIKSPSTGAMEHPISLGTHLRGSGLATLPYRSVGALTKSRSHLGSVQIDDASISMAIPDAGSNYNIFPDDSYLTKIVRRINIPVEGVAGARETTFGSARIAQLNTLDDVVLSDLTNNSIVVPTCESTLIGNKNRDLKFDSWNTELVQIVGGDKTRVLHRIPVQEQDGSYAVPTYVFRKGVSHTLDEIRELLLKAHGRQSSADEVLSVDDVPVDSVSSCPSRWSPMRVADLYCGIGTITDVAPQQGCTVVAAADKDPYALRQYEYVHGLDIPLYGNVSRELDKEGPSSLRTAIQDIDLVAMGTPCHNFSSLNMHSDLRTAESGGCLWSIPKVLDSKPKMVLVENVTNLLKAQRGKLFQNLQHEIQSKGYVVDCHVENATSYGSCQSRGRLFISVIRDDVVAKCGPLMRSLPELGAAKSMRDFLDPVDDLVIREDTRKFHSRATVHPTASGAAICATTGKKGPRNSSYSIDHCCTTVVSGDTTVWDSRRGVECHRKLNLGEKANILSKPQYQCCELVPSDKHGGFMARSMDGQHLESWMGDIQAYMEMAKQKGIADVNPVPKYVHSNSAIPVFMSNSQLHKGMGHLGKQCSASMGIPFPKHCSICELGNRKKASGSKGVKGRVGTYGSHQHLDFKISYIPGTNEVVAMLGATDDKTNEFELCSMQKRTQVQHFLRQLKVDIRDKGGRLAHLITDNDSVAISQSFREFLLEDPEQLLSMELCPPHHHEYNGRAESRWAICVPIVSKSLAQLALVIGKDNAVKFWSEAYLNVKDIINRRHFKRHGSSEYEKSPIEQRTGVAPDLSVMFPFGARVSVTDHYKGAHSLAGREGVVLNMAPRHAGGVYNVLMLDTRRIVQTMDITLTPEDGQQQLKFTEMDTPEFQFAFMSYQLDDADSNLPRLPSDVLVSESDLGVDSPVIPETREEEPHGGYHGMEHLSPSAEPNLFPKQRVMPRRVLFGSSKGTPIAKSGSSVKYTVEVLKKLPHSVLKIGKTKLAKGKPNYIRNRGIVVQGLTVEVAVKTLVLNSKGDRVRYKYGDMMYDLNSNSPLYLAHPDANTDKIVAHVARSSAVMDADDNWDWGKGLPSGHVANFVHDVYGNDNWINTLPSEEQSRPEVQMFDYNGKMPDSLFDDRSQSYLRLWGDVAPVGFKADHHLQIDWGKGDVELFKFEQDLSPHGFQSKCAMPGSDVESSQKNIALGFNDKPPRHLGQMHRLPREQKYSVIMSLQKEYMGLWDRGMFRLCKVSSLKKGQPACPTTPVFTVKFNADGTFDRAKSRVCVRGDMMIPGRDFGEVQSPTCLNDSVKLMVSDCPMSHKIAVTSDIQQAFTYGRCDPKRPLYIKQFPGTEKILDSDTGEELVMKLLYRLYGDPAAPRAFHAELHGAYMSFEYKGVRWSQSKAGPCVYYLHCNAAPCKKYTTSVWDASKCPVSSFISFDKASKSIRCSSKGVKVNSKYGMTDGTVLTSAIFVDDSINTFNPGSNAHEVYLAFVDHLKGRFTMKDNCDGMGVVDSFLGMNFTWSSLLDWVRIDQPHAIDKLVKGSGEDVPKPHFTPIPPGTEVMLDECPDVDTPEGREEARLMASRCYRKRTGELQWIARSSRPDISAAVGKLSTVSHNPGVTHWMLTTYLICYLQHTRNLGIVYRHGCSDYPYAFVDVAFSPKYGWSGDDYRPFMGELFKCAGGPIAWFAKFQKSLALSSSESEYYGLTAAAIQAIHIQQLCGELGIYSDEPMLIYEDNKAAIKMSENSTNSKRTVHLDRRAHFIRAQVNQRALQLEYCPTKEMEADAMTKMLPRPAFGYLRERIGLTYEQSVGLAPRVKDIGG